MPEPTSTSGISLAAVSIALLGPMAGPYALIVFAALAGAPLLLRGTVWKPRNTLALNAERGRAA